ncbi:MAG: hypothetical protein IJB37_05455 [Peptococcaceae bacterium]|nr:hypothetical protein [Peptococcaceae bacterium]MBQ3205977.1 hypothetical protein [Peptococcaceae bacterium]
MAESSKNNSIIAYVNLAIVLFFMFGFGHIPAPAPLTQYGMAITGIFIGVVYGWTVSSSGLSWVSLLAVAALGFTDLGTCATSIAKVFSTDTAALLLFGMLMLGPVMESNLTEYVVAKVLGSKFCYKKPWNFNILIILIVPFLTLAINAFLVALFVLPIITKMFQTAGYKKGDKYPVMLVIGFFMLMEVAAVLFPWRGWGLYCTATFASSSGGYMIDYGKYMILAFLYYFALGFAYLGLMKLMRCNVEPIRDLDLTAFITTTGDGKLTKQQKGVLIAIVAMAVGCCVVSFCGGDAGIGLIFKKLGVYGVLLITLTCLLFIKVDGKPLGDMNSMAKYVMWDMLLVIAVAMLIASCMTSADTGVSAFLSKYVAPILAGKSELAFLLILAVVCLILTNLLNNMVIMLLFMALAGQFFANGIITNAPAALMIINLATILGFYTPGSSGYGAMIHGAEVCTSVQVYKYGAVAIALILLVLFVVVVPLCFILF